MNKCHLLHIFAFVAIAFFVCGKQTSAQENPHHIHVRMVPKTGLHANVVKRAKDG